MSSFMVVSTFKSGTNMNEVLKVVGEEQKRVAELQASGMLGSTYLATASRQCVFLEVFAPDKDEAEAIVQRLPMAKWWNLDVYPLNQPVEVES